MLPLMMGAAIVAAIFAASPLRGPDAAAASARRGLAESAARAGALSPALAAEAARLSGQGLLESAGRALAGAEPAQAPRR